jgi:hypothetical protein
MRAILLVLALLLGGCEKLKNTPVALQDTPLPGHWYGERSTDPGESGGGPLQERLLHERLYMHVREDGHAAYAFMSCLREQGHPVAEKKLTLAPMPVIRLTTRKMVLQGFPLTPKFELTLGAWPDEGAGVFEVDGVPLRAISAATAPDVEQWHCNSGADSSRNY